MKTMTCRQMGGPCDAPLQGNTADEMMNNGAIHVKKQAEKGDGAHKKILEMMDAMLNTPEAGEWHDKFVKDFDAIPEDK